MQLTLRSLNSITSFSYLAWVALKMYSHGSHVLCCISDISEAKTMSLDICYRFLVFLANTNRAKTVTCTERLTLMLLLLRTKANLQVRDEQESCS